MHSITNDLINYTYVTGNSIKNQKCKIQSMWIGEHEENTESDASTWGTGTPQPFPYIMPDTSLPSGCSRVLCLYACVCAKSHQSHLTLCNLMDCSLPGSSVQGILQARTLEGIAVPSSRGPSQPRDQTCISCISCIGRRLLYH